MVTESNLVEATHHLEGAEVLLHVELVDRIGGVEDEVEGEGELLVPVLLAGHDELLGTHLEGILLLVRAVGEDVDFGSQSDGPEDGKVAETSQSNDCDLLSWTRAEADERAVDGDT